MSTEILGFGGDCRFCGASLWKHIRSGWSNFSRFIKFEVGNGLCIKFWQDPWCGDLILKEAFPKLFFF